jgi:hypothetical protein
MARLSGIKEDCVGSQSTTDCIAWEGEDKKVNVCKARLCVYRWNVVTYTVRIIRSRILGWNSHVRFREVGEMYTEYV